MGITTNIQWTSRTQNFWQGCHKIAPECKYCYMFRDKERYGQEPDIVVRSKDKTFNQPLKWHKDLTGEEPLSERLVFTNSWSDFFIKESDEWREDAWNIIRQTPHLIWQILTKRPERIKECLPSDWGEGWDNVWLGTSAGTQKTADKWIPDLLRVPARIRFVSFEPLLEPIDLTSINHWESFDRWIIWHDLVKGKYFQIDEFGRTREENIPKLDWAIIGGESGNKSGYYRYRPCNLDWIRSLKTQLQDSGTKVFIKQFGTYLSDELGLGDAHGGDINEFPDDLKLHELPII